MFLLIFLEKEEREKNIGWLLPVLPPDWGPSPQPGMYPDRELNLQPFGSWGDTHPTEPHGSAPSLPFHLLNGTIARAFAFLIGLFRS